MSDESGTKRAIPTISAEADILCKRLQKLAPGEFVAYSELNALIRGDVQDRHRGILQTARRKASREFAVVTMTVVSEGLRRAAGMDYAGIAERAMTHTRRTCKRALSDSLQMPEDEYASLDDQGKVALNTKRTMLGTLSFFATARAEKRIEGAVKVQNSRLAIGEVLELSK